MNGKILRGRIVWLLVACLVIEPLALPVFSEGSSQYTVDENARFEFRPVPVEDGAVDLSNYTFVSPTQLQNSLLASMGGEPASSTTRIVEEYGKAEFFRWVLSAYSQMNEGDSDVSTLLGLIKWTWDQRDLWVGKIDPAANFADGVIHGLGGAGTLLFTNPSARPPDPSSLRVGCERAFSWLSRVDLATKWNGCLANKFLQGISIEKDGQELLRYFVKDPSAPPSALTGSQAALKCGGLALAALGLVNAFQSYDDTKGQNTWNNMQSRLNGASSVFSIIGFFTILGPAASVFGIAVTLFIIIGDELGKMNKARKEAYKRSFDWLSEMDPNFRVVYNELKNPPEGFQEWVSSGYPPADASFQYLSSSLIKAFEEKYRIEKYLSPESAKAYEPVLEENIKRGVMASYYDNANWLDPWPSLGRLESMWKSKAAMLGDCPAITDFNADGSPSYEKPGFWEGLWNDMVNQTATEEAMDDQNLSKVEPSNSATDTPDFVRQDVPSEENDVYEEIVYPAAYYNPDFFVQKMFDSFKQDPPYKNATDVEFLDVRIEQAPMNFFWLLSPKKVDIRDSVDKSKIQLPELLKDWDQATVNDAILADMFCSGSKEFQYAYDLLVNCTLPELQKNFVEKYCEYRNLLRLFPKGRLEGLEGLIADESADALSGKYGFPKIQKGTDWKKFLGENQEAVQKEVLKVYHTLVLMRHSLQQFMVVIKMMADQKAFLKRYAKEKQWVRNEILLVEEEIDEPGTRFRELVKWGVCTEEDRDKFRIRNVTCRQFLTDWAFCGNEGVVDEALNFFSDILSPSESVKSNYLGFNSVLDEKSDSIWGKSFAEGYSKIVQERFEAPECAVRAHGEGGEEWNTAADCISLVESPEPIPFDFKGSLPLKDSWEKVQDAMDTLEKIVKKLQDNGVQVDLQIGDENPFPIIEPIFKGCVVPEINLDQQVDNSPQESDAPRETPASQ